MTSILQIENLSKNFGGLQVLQGIDIEIQEGEIYGIVGPNGSGKTTLLNVITGFLKPDKGSLIYKGQSISGLKPYQIANKGIVRTFQITSTFPRLTSEMNIITAFHIKTKGGFWGSFFHTRSHRTRDAELKQKANEILRLMEIYENRHMPAQNLPAAEQRKLEIAIALAAEPDTLLLDEPAAGMSSEEQARLVSMIKSMQKQGMTILIIEHNMKVIMGLCTRLLVLNYGTKLAQGTPGEILNDERVIEIYLGKRKNA